MRKNFEVNDWFFPLPVLIIGTYDEDGKPNAMNAAWGGIYDYGKIIVAMSVTHKSRKNINATGAFTVSFADKKNVIPADYVGLVSGNNTPDKMEKSGFTTEKATSINAPVIKELPFALECIAEGTTENGNIIGKIVNISVDESILGEDGLVDIKKFAPIAFNPVQKEYYTLGEKVGDAFKSGLELK